MRNYQHCYSDLLYFGLGLILRKYPLILPLLISPACARDSDLLQMTTDMGHLSHGANLNLRGLPYLLDTDKAQYLHSRHWVSLMFIWYKHKLLIIKHTGNGPIQSTSHNLEVSKTIFHRPLLSASLWPTHIKAVFILLQRRAPIDGFWQKGNLGKVFFFSYLQRSVR